MNLPIVPDERSTPSSIFLRLNAAEPRPRELAWHEFWSLYAPIIAGFARNIGIAAQDVDDIVQDVLTGFYSVSPTFVYDPQKGRFRGYLKTATQHAIAKATARNGIQAVPLATLDRAAATVDAQWEVEWMHHLLSRALDQVRRKYPNSITLKVYERYVLDGAPPQAVAEKFGVSVDTVYQAKARITDVLKRIVSQLEQDEG
jgi:RNA polymerase sigma factor (sigma-70 family)